MYNSRHFTHDLGDNLFSAWPPTTLPLQAGSDGYPLPYPTLPGFYFYYPYPTRKYFKNFRVQGSNYTCCFQSRIISMMPANQLRGERNSLKIGKIFTTSTHTLFRNIQVINWQKCRAWTNTSSIYNEYSLILVQKTKKRRKVLTFFFVVFIKVTWSSVGMVMFSWVNFSCLRLSAQGGPEPTFDRKFGPKNSQTHAGHRMTFQMFRLSIRSSFRWQ